LPASLSVKKGSIADDPFNLLLVVSSIGKKFGGDENLPGQVGKPLWIMHVLLINSHCDWHFP
jgi:hypothetical protein